MKKTIKQLADELKVSKQTIRYHLKSLPVKDRNVTGKENIILDSEDIRLIKDKLTKSKKHVTSKEVVNNCNVTGKENEYLIEQLQEKDKQIERLQNLLENQQILTLKEQDKVEFLESKKDNIDEEKKKRKWKFWK